ncbi:MAG: hypothetical protein BM564_00190 [Bacteroidetes bacterium MedPE-SWsnd-G2]|nr:MAG: hypothetical protein BM564_00190 [Bacteroidetes bacterium MedPE-SWsnd-G2]
MFAQQQMLDWDSSRPLIWTDFKAQPDQNSSAVAVTTSGISYGFTSKSSNGKVVSYEVEISTHFYPHKSWQKKEIVNDYVLRHEQFHFNITELFARRFREKISDLKMSQDVKSKVDLIYKKITSDLNDMQNLYDYETQHSKEKNTQQQWESKIEAMLEQLDQYKS